MVDGKKDGPGMGESATAFGAALFPGAAALGAGAYGLFKLFESGKQELTDEEIARAKEGKGEELRAKKAITSPVPTQLEPYRPPGQPLGVPYLEGGTTEVPLYEYQRPPATDMPPYGETITIYDKASGEEYVVPSGQLYGEPGKEITYKGKRVSLTDPDAPRQLLLGEGPGEMRRMVFDRSVTDIQPGNLLDGTGGDIFKTLRVKWGVPDKDTSFIDFIRQRVPNVIEQTWAETGQGRFVSNREAINWFEGVFPTYQEKVIRRKKKTKERPIPKDLAVSVHGASDDPRQEPDLTKHAPFWQKRDVVKQDLFRKRDDLAQRLALFHKAIQEGNVDLIPDAEEIEKEIVGLSSRKEYQSLFFTDEEARLSIEFAKLDPKKRFRWLQRHKKFLDKTMPYGTVPRQGDTVDRAIAAGKWARVRVPVPMYTQDQWHETIMRIIDAQKSKVRVPISPRMGFGAVLRARKGSPIASIDKSIAQDRLEAGESLPLTKATALITAYKHQLKDVATPEHVRSVAERLWQANREQGPPILEKGLKQTLTEMGHTLQGLPPAMTRPEMPTEKELAEHLPHARSIIGWELWRDLVEDAGGWRMKDPLRVDPASMRLKFEPAGGEFGLLSEKTADAWKWFVGELPEESTWFDIPWTDGRYGIGNPFASEGNALSGTRVVAQKFIGALLDVYNFYAGPGYRMYPPGRMLGAGSTWTLQSMGMDRPEGPTTEYIPSEVMRRDARDRRSNAIINFLRLDDPESAMHGMFGLRWNDKAQWDIQLNEGKGGWRGGWEAADFLTSWKYDGPKGEDLKVIAKYDAMGPWEVTKHVVENMPEEIAGLIMLLPHVGELIIDLLAEPFSGRSAVESAERFTKMGGTFLDSLGESLLLHMGDPKAGLVEQGMITQFLWYIPIGQFASFLTKGLLKTRLMAGFRKRLTDGRAPLIETGDLVIEDATGRLRPARAGEKTLYEQAQIELRVTEKAHKKAAVILQRAWKAIRDRIDKPKGKKPRGARRRKKHEKQAAEYEAALDAEARLAQNVEVVKASIRQYETRVPNPEIAALPRNIAVFLEYLPRLAKQMGIMGLPFTASPLGVLETLGLFVDWAVTMEGLGILRHYLKKPTQLLGAPLRSIMHQFIWEQNRANLINRRLAENVPKEHRQTLQDTMYGGGKTGTVGRQEVPAGGKASKVLDEIRDAQMRRVLREGEDLATITLEELKLNERIWQHYEERLPGVVWDTSAKVKVSRVEGGTDIKVGGWQINPVLEGEISAALYKQFKGQAEFMNKWGRDLSLRALEISRDLKTLRFWNPLTESWQYGLFDNQAALNNFWWPQQFKSWGRVTHFINRLWGKALGRDRAMPLWEETIAQMRRDMEVPVTGEGVPGMGAASTKLQVSKLNERGYSLEAKKLIGMEQNLINQAVGGLGEAQYALNQFKVYQAIARDPLLCFQGSRVRGGTFRKPGIPPGVSKILSGGIERRGRWIKMGSDVMYPGSKTPRHGELAGRWVHEDIFWHLKYTEEIALVASKSGWARATVYFKQAHTVWNAPTLLRNLYTNFLLLAPMNNMMPIAGNLKYWTRALKEMTTGGKLYELAYKHGAFDGTFAQSELGRTASTTVLRGLLVRGKLSWAELRALPENLATGNIAGLSETGRLFLVETPGVLYNSMDTWPRFADWLKMTNMGKNLKVARQAATDVQHRWLNYGDAAGWVQVFKAPSQMHLGMRNLTFALAGKPFVSYLALTMEAKGPIRTWLRNNPIVAQIYMNLHEVLSVHNFAEALGSDVKAAKKWMKLIKSQAPGWRRFRYIPMSSTGVIGDMIELLAGEPGIRATERVIKKRIFISAEEYGALPEGSYIAPAFRTPEGEIDPEKGADAVEVKTLGEAVRLASESLGEWGTTPERRLEIQRIVREGTGVRIRWDPTIKMWGADKEVTNRMLIPMVTRWFNLGYYTPIDWLIPQLESFDRSGMLLNLGKQIFINQNPLTTIATAWLTGEDPYFKTALDEEVEGATETEKVMSFLWTRAKYALQTMAPPWIPYLGKSWEKLEAIGDKDYRGRVRDSMEVWFDVFLGIRYESDVSLPEGIQRQMGKFIDEVGSVDKRVKDWTVEAFKDRGIPTTFSVEELLKIAEPRPGQEPHPEISEEDAKAALDYYKKLKAQEGIKILRELQSAIGDIPGLPAKYGEPFKLDDVPPSALLVSERGPDALVGETIDVVAIKGIIESLPLDEWEHMITQDSDIDEEAWVAWLQKNLPRKVTEMSRGELEVLATNFKERSKGYNMVYHELFGVWRPDEKAWGKKGIITVLHLLGTRFGKFIKHEEVKRMYKPKEKKNGND